MSCKLLILANVVFFAPDLHRSAFLALTHFQLPLSLARLCPQLWLWTPSPVGPAETGGGLKHVETANHTSGQISLISIGLGADGSSFHPFFWSVFPCVQGAWTGVMALERQDLQKVLSHYNDACVYIICIHTHIYIDTYIYITYTHIHNILHYVP